METLTDGTKNGAGHLHKFPREKERENLDSKTEEDAEAGSFAGVIDGRGNNGPAGKVGGAKEETEGRVENEHTKEGIFPFCEPFFGIGKKKTDESERSNHDEDRNGSLAHGDSDEADSNRDNGADKNGDESPEEGAEAAGKGDCDAGCGGGAGDEADEVRPGYVELFDGAARNSVFFDI